MYQNNRLQNSRSRPKKLASPKGLFFAALLVVLMIIAGGALLFIQKNQPTDQTNGNTDASQNSFDKTKNSLTNPASPWVVVNKQRPLDPENYAPPALRTPNISTESSSHQVNNQTADALEALANAAASDGVELILVSAYRSYDRQAEIYDSMVRGYGQAEADRESARPGHSEHQTGWAADLGAANGKCELLACFADTPEGKWLDANAHKFGFIIRYSMGKEHITGYVYEPWHLRFVGTELAAELHRTGLTMEEFFGLPAAQNY